MHYRKTYGKRKLPGHTARVAFAAIEKKDRFRRRLSGWRRRLRPGLTGDISALADGAAWIWDIVRLEFSKVCGCLDVYHALAHLSGIGKLFYGEESAVYKKWYALAKKDLLLGGYKLIEKRLVCLEGEERTDQRESLHRLCGYFSTHSERLLEGRAIGSGQVGGACKSMAELRLKQTGARWKVRNLNRMLSLCALPYSDAWNNYWCTAI